MKYALFKKEKIAALFISIHLVSIGTNAWHDWIKKGARKTGEWGRLKNGWLLGLISCAREPFVGLGGLLLIGGWLFFSPRF